MVLNKCNYDCKKDNHEIFKLFFFIKSGKLKSYFSIKFSLLKNFISLWSVRYDH